MTPEQKRIEQIKKKLANLGALLPGSLSQQWNVCGSPKCKCKDPQRPVKHGPYDQLSYTLQGKSSTVFVKKHQLKEVRLCLKRYKQFKALCNELIEAYIVQFRRQGASKP